MRREAPVVAALLLACACSDESPGPGASPAPPAARSSSPFRSVQELPAASDPVRVRLPRIGVDAAVERLGKLPDGTVDVPRQWQQVGWYAEGPRPGEAGPAVLLGHVDSKAGPAVFFRLRELGPGDRVEVATASGRAVTFVVRRVAQHPKDDFPTDEVYLPTLRREVRLVTCGGAFDRGTGHYRDNVIVFAEAAA